MKVSTVIKRMRAMLKDGWTTGAWGDYGDSCLVAACWRCCFDPIRKQSFPFGVEDTKDLDSRAFVDTMDVLHAHLPRAYQSAPPPYVGGDTQRRASGDDLIKWNDSQKRFEVVDELLRASLQDVVDYEQRTKHNAKTLRAWLDTFVEVDVK